MTIAQAEKLNEVIEKYNAASEIELCWWEVLDEIGDISDAQRVEAVILAIEAEAGAVA